MHRMYNACIMYSVWGGPTPFLPMEKCVFPFFPTGKNGKKKYMERKGKVFISFSFHILFSPFFPMGKNGKTHIFPWAKMGLDPPPVYTVYYIVHNEREYQHYIYFCGV